MSEEYIKYLEILKKDNVDTETIKSFILRIKELFDEFVSNTEGELTKDECLEQFLDAYRDDLKYDKKVLLRNCFILNQYCSYKELLNLYKGNKQELRRLLLEAKRIEKGSGKDEELRITYDTKEQLVVSLREILRQIPNISEKDLLVTIQKRKSSIAEYLKTELIKTIHENIGFLNEYGRIDEYIRMANEILKEVGLDGMMYQKRNPIPDEYGDGKGNFIRYDEAKKQYVKYDDNGKVVNDGEDLSKYEQDIGIIDAFDEDILRKLGPEDLFMMDLFYRCIYFAERLELTKTMYAMEKMGLWKTIYEGTKEDIEGIDDEEIINAFETDDEKPLIDEEIENIRNTAKDMTMQECTLVGKLKSREFNVRSWGVVDYNEEEDHINIAIDNQNFRGPVVIAVSKTILADFIEGDVNKLPKYKDREKLDDKYSFVMGKLYIPATDFYKKYVMKKYKENPSSKLFALLTGKKVKKGEEKGNEDSTR